MASLYRLYVPKQAVGANIIYFDLWLPKGQFVIDLLGVQPIVSGAVAVAGVVGVDLILTRTSAVGSSAGASATYEGTDPTLMTISAHDNAQPLRDSQLSARLTPTAGATGGAVLAWRSVFTEETNDATYTACPDLARGYFDVPGIFIPDNSGFRVIQGAVASVGNIGFDVLFRLRDK